MSEFLKFDSISKSFPGVKALDQVSFGVPEGSVRALCGENGAGKSTLLKILSGVYHADSGEVRVGGDVHAPKAPVDALRAGIAVIYQELHLFDDLTVAENLYMGHLPSQMGLVNRGELRRMAKQRLDDIGADVSPDAKIGRLSIAQRQMVEIAKAMTHDAKVIAFDEPTSSLSSREVDKLFELIARLKAEGRVILYVSHRMEEIFEVCDSATVLRDGQHAATFETLEDVTSGDIVSAMVGRSIEDVYGYETRSLGDEMLSVQDLIGPGLIEPASLSLRKGEILGIFGLVGAGRTELLHLMYGSRKKRMGTLKLEGRDLRIRGPIDSIKAGILFCPEDRKKEGIIPIRSVKENINISARRKNAFGKFIIQEAWEKKNAQAQVDRLKVKTPHLMQEIRNLSGGNQQKSILGRWLSEDVKVMLLDEPTRGIDIGAKSEIYSIIYELAEQGVGVIVVSSELPEVLGISDRIAVMCEGRITGILDRSEANQEAVMNLALPSADHGRRPA